MIPPAKNNTSLAEAQVREALGARLGTDLSGEEFAFLVLQGGIEEIKKAVSPDERERSLKRATETIANLRLSQGKAVGQKAREVGGAAGDDTDQRYALSRLLALEALREPEVIQFKETYLGGGFLDWEKIKEWIEAKAEAEGEHSTYIEVVVPPGAEVRPSASGLRIESSVPLAELATEGGIKAKFLTYGVPGDRWVKHTPVRAGGVLDELRKVCERLARDYRFTPDQACVLVLCGVTPYMVGVRAQTEVQSAHPAASRICLEVDPVVAPVEVQKRYSDIRQKLLKGSYQPLRDKHLRLAVFAAERRPPAKWAQVMDEWNREYPSETYDTDTIFARDCTAAQRRLLRPRLDPDAVL